MSRIYQAWRSSLGSNNLGLPKFQASGSSIQDYSDLLSLNHGLFTVCQSSHGEYPQSLPNGLIMGKNDQLNWLFLSVPVRKSLTLNVKPSIPCALYNLNLIVLQFKRHNPFNSFRSWISIEVLLGYGQISQSEWIPQSLTCPPVSHNPL